jgi:hypothetical protein
MEFLRGAIGMIMVLIVFYSGYAIISNALGTSCIDPASEGY